MNPKRAPEQPLPGSGFVRVDLKAAPQIVASRRLLQSLPEAQRRALYELVDAVRGPAAQATRTRYNLDDLS